MIPVCEWPLWGKWLTGAGIALLTFAALHLQGLQRLALDCVLGLFRRKLVILVWTVQSLIFWLILAEQAGHQVRWAPAWIVKAIQDANLWIEQEVPAPPSVVWLGVTIVIALVSCLVIGGINALSKQSNTSGTTINLVDDDDPPTP